MSDRNSAGEMPPLSVSQEDGLICSVGELKTNVRKLNVFRLHPSSRKALGKGHLAFHYSRTEDHDNLRYSLETTKGLP